MTIEQGQQAPLPNAEFSDAEGQAHDLRRVAADGPLLLGIYKSSCASSKQMFPFLERLHERYAADGLSVLGISQDSANITRSFARRYGITFPLLLEGDDYPVSRAFDIMATPTVFLIEPGGTVAYATMGFMKPALDALADAVADAVEKPHQVLVTPDDSDVPMFVPG
ncbi:MAG: alkyl hydroperoxide reductase/Thiol specific antioxidant/Mal allergen [Thermomicrobiales bacterium]|jgi:peroxiredoxin|nr:alkyl hydroperoxide reductase/Thiol specific antioxidant/Mal allergen [Thermomicrobiales bacterium]MDF3018097.1 alkyl hydroperoxide reductase/Thiol specific antioxidant/Mal allergen [Thermomicrobiales bacterium]